MERGPPTSRTPSSKRGAPPGTPDLSRAQEQASRRPARPRSQPPRPSLSLHFMPTQAATAVAHPNIALAKYWGKLAEGHNLPAVPSLSVTLAGMSTITTVTFDPSLGEDELELGGTSIRVG